nr:reverse transcriptase domain-containing protein [Tanacetum cinerariifolium]
MILELVDQSTTRPASIVEDVFVKVGKFYFPTDFVVVDYVVNPHVPLILGRPFLRTGHALIDYYGEELTVHVDDEAITFKVGQISKFSYNDAESINRVDVIDVAYEEYVQEVLGFSDNSKSGNPTPIFDPIIALSSLSLTSFEGGDFILEEIEACLTSESIPPGINDTDLDLEGDIRLLEKLLNNDPSLSLLPPKELNVEEIKTVKSSIDEPPELELKELPKVQLNKLNELHDQAYENSLIYKEKTKKIHESKIKNRVFNVGDRALLFNSHLKIFLGKLKTRWTRPFTIAHVFPYGTIELSQADGPNFKDFPRFRSLSCSLFVHRPLELQSLAYGNPISEIILI